MNAIELIESPPAAAQPMNPYALLAIAVQQGADIERLERLLALQERYEAEQARKAYSVAFSAFKAEAVAIIKNKRVTDGPLKGKSYAELFAVVEAVTPALSKHGLSAAWKITKDERDWLEVTCTLRHIAGGSESVSMGAPPDTGGAKNGIQARASAVTYLERYTLKAITGLSEQDEDDDGNKGSSDRRIDTEADPLSQPRNLGLSPARYNIVRAVARDALQHFNEGDEVGAYGDASTLTDDNEKLALWSILKPHSALRSAIRRMGEEERAAEEKLKRERA